MAMGYKLPCAHLQDHKESKGPIHYITSAIIWGRVSKMAKCLYLIYGCSINRKLSSGAKLTWPNVFIVTLSAEKVIKITQAKMIQITVYIMNGLCQHIFLCLSRLKLYNCNYSKQYEHRVRWRDALIRTDKAVWQHLTLHLSLLFFHFSPLSNTMGSKLLFSANWVKAEPEVREQQFLQTRHKICLSTASVLVDLQPVSADAP